MTCIAPAFSRRIFTVISYQESYVLMIIFLVNSDYILHKIVVKIFCISSSFLELLLMNFRSLLSLFDD